MVFMNVNEVLQFVDKLVFDRTGKHLDDVQTAVIEGSWQKQTYDDIAKKCFVSKNHISDVGYQLWQILSEELGEDLKKSNFRSSLERLNIKSSDSCQNNCSIFNFGSQNLYNSPQNSQETDKNNITNSCYHNLKFAPKITRFFDRHSELDQLSDFILNKNIPLISVLGLSGIGKTYLVKRFIDLNLDKFEVIIWKDLQLSNCLGEFITEILANEQLKTTNLIKTSSRENFLNLLQSKKCLIIFDNVEELFISGQFAGQFKPEYKEYQELFTRIKTTEHQSNLILISQEQCSEMLNENLEVDGLELGGLNTIEILKNLGLQDEECWLNLVNLYWGNPVYLQEIASLIKDFYDGKVKDFLAENTSILTTEASRMLALLYNRLSPQEKEVILAISTSNKPLSKEELKNSLNLSSWDLINSLKSLKLRFLLIHIKGNFDLIRVFKEYVKVVVAPLVLP